MTPWHEPGWFTDTLKTEQEGLCTWCQRALAGRAEVDHNHDCPIHDASRTACGHCVRGLVHRRCNRAIAVWDRRAEAGITVPDDIRAYLEPWERATT